MTSSELIERISSRYELTPSLIERLCSGKSERISPFWVGGFVRYCQFNKHACYLTNHLFKIFFAVDTFFHNSELMELCSESTMMFKNVAYISLAILFGKIFLTAIIK